MKQVVVGALLQGDAMDISRGAVDSGFRTDADRQLAAALAGELADRRRLGWLRQTLGVRDGPGGRSESASWGPGDPGRAPSAREVPTAL